jgi:hypothetical protein
MKQLAYEKSLGIIDIIRHLRLRIAVPESLRLRLSPTPSRECV